ncbi:MAG: hypothetical protein EHM40_20790 [Chloroflexi bacterium]|nr:MAG: hypothetical protein EHM40_20790 [Chloroflexota bacterium]
MKNLTESKKWKLIKELEDQLLPEDTIQARWIRLNELAQLGKELDLHVDNSDKMIVWERWAKIKDAYEKRLMDGKPPTK